MKGKMKILFCDDSMEAYKRAYELWMPKKRDLEIRQYVFPDLNYCTKSIIDYNPDVIVTDLMKGRGAEDGYRLINEIQSIPQLENVPIIVVSKQINSSRHGIEQKKRALSTPGVVGAYGKVPNYPDLDIIVENMLLHKAAKASEKR
jgi:CheY-like chemotaxis protein